MVHPKCLLSLVSERKGEREKQEEQVTTDARRFCVVEGRVNDDQQKDE